MIKAHVSSIFAMYKRLHNSASFEIQLGPAIKMPKSAILNAHIFLWRCHQLEDATEARGQNLCAFASPPCSTVLAVVLLFPYPWQHISQSIPISVGFTVLLRERRKSIQSRASRSGDAGYPWASARGRLYSTMAEWYEASPHGRFTRARGDGIFKGDNGRRQWYHVANSMLDINCYTLRLATDHDSRRWTNPVPIRSRSVRGYLGPTNSIGVYDSDHAFPWAKTVRCVYRRRQVYRWHVSGSGSSTGWSWTVGRCILHVDERRQPARWKAGSVRRPSVSEEFGVGANGHECTKVFARCAGHFSEWHLLVSPWHFGIAVPTEDAACDHDMRYGLVPWRCHFLWYICCAVNSWRNILADRTGWRMAILCQPLLGRPTDSCEISSKPAFSGICMLEWRSSHIRWTHNGAPNPVSSKCRGRVLHGRTDVVRQGLVEAWSG